MQAEADRISDKAPDGIPAGTPATASSSRRAGLHHLALALVLFALLPVAGRHAVWSADEGALLYQVDALADGRGWTFDHPFPEADPTGTYFPIHLSSWAQDGERAEADSGRYVVLAKHTWFLWAATGLYKLGGYGAIVAASVVAAVAAAIATSRLAAMVEPAARLPALWIIGLGSPLFVGAYVAWAHALGAALIGWAAVGLLAENRRGRLAGLILVVLACLVRTEAPLAGFAIGLGLIGAALVEPSHRPGIRPDRLVTGSCAIIAAAAGLALDRATDVDTGGPVEPVDSATGFGLETASGFDAAIGFIAGRLEAFSITWLRPAYGSDPRDLLILVAASATLFAGILARRGPAGAHKVTVALVVAVAALLARFLVTPTALVPGLVVAFPTLFAGLLLMDRKAMVDDRLIAVVAPFVLFCGAVLATQYRQGGGGEWGGRYFTVGLPLGVAAAAVGLVRAGARFSDRDRRRLGGLAVASMLLLSVMGLAGLRSVRNQTEALARDVELAVEQLERAGTDGTGADARPVVVTTVAGAGRWLWDDIDRGRWLRVPGEDLELVGARLHDLGVERLAFVSSDRGQLDQLDPWYEVDIDGPEISTSPLVVVTLVARR